MGKGSDLWDDSALINAFDHAMTTYKVMHSKTYNGDSPAEEEKHTCGNNENEPVFTEKISGQRHTEPEDNNSAISNNAMETYVPCYNTEASTEDFPIQENNLSHTNSSDLPCQTTVDYNQLLRQFNELEEQKQKVAQQLHQASYWNIQTPVQCPTCQVLPAPTLDPSEHGLQPACSLCSCCCLAWSAYCPASHTHQYPGLQCPFESGTCSISTSCVVDPEKQSSQADDNAVKIGMMAAEKVLSSMQKGISASSNICDGKEKGKDKYEGSGIYGGIGLQGTTSPETDFAAVLSAWYAAGFHTGRYLLEQSKRDTLH